MAEIKNIREIEKIMRTAIIKNTGIDGNFVRNLVTEFSVDLDKDYTSSIFNSLSSENVAILFEVIPDNNVSNMSEDIYNSKNIVYYQYFKLKVIIYGDDSCTTAIRLISRLRSLSVRDNLIAQGINLASVSEISEVNEIVNGVVWQRSDFEVLIGCELIIEPIENSYEIQDYSNLSIYKK